jgi:hypothetical protein
MRRFCTPLLRGAGVVCGLLLATSLYAQSTGRTATGKVYRMEINNGLNRTVRYSGQNLSPGEDSTLREMERVENESIYVQNLLELKKQYVVGERIEEVNRRYVQHQLYGQEYFQSAGPWGFVGSTYPGYGSPYAGGFFGAYTAYGNYPYLGGAGFAGFFGNSSGTTRTLAIGVGDEGRIKAATAPVIASQATPEYAVAVNQAYEQVMMRATDSPVLVKALRLPSPQVLARTRERTVSFTKGPWVRLTLKTGGTIEGYSFDENKDWYIVYLDKDKNVQTRIRQAEVVRVDAGHARGGIVPAVRD